MRKFSGYAFNKAHATAYATITYWMLYLKERYPLPFYKALFNRYHGIPERVFAILSECGKRDLPVCLPDIGKSGMQTEIEDKGLRLGFQMVKGISPDLFKIVIQERPKVRFHDSEGLFRSLPPELLDDQTIYQLYHSGLASFSGETVTIEGLMAIRDRVKNEMLTLKRTLFGEREEQGATRKTPIKSATKRVDQSDPQSAVSPIERLGGHLAAFGLLLDYQTVFGLKFPPFSTLTEMHLTIITEVSSDKRVAKGSDGLRHFSFRIGDTKVEIGDTLILHGRKEVTVIGRWERSLAILSFSGEAFFQREDEMQSSLSRFKEAGVRRVMIQLSGKTMEVRL